jgi:hypothetical protein
VQTLGKFIAGICAVLFIITGVMALLFFNIERKAFDSTTYKQAFENQNLYARMPSILANTLSATILQNQNTPTFIKTLTLTDWEAAVSSMLPPEELKAVTDDALDSVFDYINRRADSVNISLIPLKSRLIGPSGVELVKQVLRVQPACTTEQLQAIAFGFLSGGDIILCSPPEDVLTLLTPIIESQIQVLTVAVPDEVTLISSVLSGTPGDPRVRLNNVRLLMLISPLLPAAFLLGITIFAVRSLKDWLMWWGWPVFITGASALIVALLGSPTIGFIVSRFMQIQAANLIPPSLLAIMQETASSVTREILQPVTLEGLILAVIGLTMAIAAVFVVQRKDYV